MLFRSFLPCIKKLYFLISNSSTCFNLEMTFSEKSKTEFWLGVSIEDILESARTDYRSSFETFKSNTCHHVKDMGDVDFMIHVLETDEIRTLYERRWYPEALYLLAMLDYLSRENSIPICTRYDDIRARRLSKPIYPAGVLLTSKVLKSEAPLRKAEQEAIPEFLRFNIIENEVRNVV